MKSKVISTKKAFGSIFLGILILVIGQILSSIVYIIPISSDIASIIFGVLYIFIVFNLMKFSCSKILHISMEECYVGKPRLFARWIVSAILLPTGVILSFLLVNGNLIINQMPIHNIIIKIVYSVFTVGLSIGIVEEMIFRGLIMKITELRWGKKIAILIPSILFGLLHIIGLEFNFINVLLLFVAGTSVGIMFSLIVYECGSIWSSALVHGLWNAIMIGDIINVGIEYNNNSIIYYELTSKSLIVTGGEFGIESSLIAVIGYIIVIIFSLYLIRKKVKL